MDGKEAKRVGNALFW